MGRVQPAVRDPGVDPFRDDVREVGGYRYTTDAPLSSRMANRRLTDVSLEVADFDGRRVIDVGCGDGTYSVLIAEEGGAASVEGIDPAEEAVATARERPAPAGVSFSVASAYEIPHPERSFDVAYLRGVLHHMDEPERALREALRVADRIVVIEPNGLSPLLKILERASSYHREHGERSYPPSRLDRWVSEGGGTVDVRRWAGFVPMFAPDALARVAKRIEPLVERAPLLNRIGCAVYVFSARRDDA